MTSISCVWCYRVLGDISFLSFFLSTSVSMARVLYTMVSCYNMGIVLSSDVYTKVSPFFTEIAHTQIRAYSACACKITYRVNEEGLGSEATGIHHKCILQLHVHFHFHTKSPPERGIRQYHFLVKVHLNGRRFTEVLPRECSQGPIKAYRAPPLLTTLASQSYVSSNARVSNVYPNVRM